MMVSLKEQNYEITIIYSVILILVSISKYDDNDDKEFNNIDGKLTVFSYSQADNNVFYSPVHNGSRSSPIESLTLNNFNEISNRNFDSIETLSAENSPEFDEQLFPEVQLAESPMDFIETTTENIPERINLKSVDSSIQKQLVSVSIQPTNNDRRRYKCEGKRRIKKLLRNPMTVDACFFFFFFSSDFVLLVIKIKKLRVGF